MDDNKKNSPRTIIFIFSGVIFILSVLLFFYKQATKTKLDKRLSQNKPLTVLFTGLTSDDKISLAIFAIIFPKDKKCGLYFINPLSSFDSRQDIIETMGSSNIGSLSKKISSISNYPVHYTIQFGEKDFEKFVDIAGGYLFYFDNKQIQSSKFLWKAGEEILWGEESLEYLKLNGNTPLDYVERINRQLSVILTIYDKFQQNKDFPKEWVKYFLSLAKTDLNPIESLSLLDFLISNHIVFSTSELPGEFQIDKKTKEPFLLVKEDTAKISFRNFEKNVKSDYFLDGEKARTEVLNATEVKGLAKRVKSILNDKRIKVLTVENAWIEDQKTTTIIDRSGNTEYTYKIAEILNTKKIRHLIRKELGLDTTVIVGEDFEIKP